MSYSSLASFLSVITIYFLVHHVSAHSVEGIIGGKIVQAINYKYQVSIQSVKNNSRNFISICSGCLIGNEFVLTAAFCFVDTHGQLAQASFSALLAANTVTSGYAIRVDILYIYLPGFEDNFKLSNIAVAKLKEDLNIARDYRLSVLELPLPYQSFSLRVGKVTGYGYNKITTRIDLFGIETRINGSSDGFLKYINVNILHDRECKRKYSSIYSANQMCGTTLPSISNRRWGICTEDTGAPLVIENTVVGVASIHPVHCDDTVISSIYVKVSYFVNFIQGIMLGYVPKQAIVYHNRKQLSYI